MASRSELIVNHLASLSSFLRAEDPNPKDMKAMLSGVVNWSSLLRAAKSDLDELTFLSSLALACCLINDEDLLLRSPNVSETGLSRIYDEAHDKADPDLIPLLDPLARRISFLAEGDDEEEDLVESGLQQRVINVDNLNEKVNAQTSEVQAALKKILSTCLSPVSKKRKATSQLTNERTQPVQAPRDDSPPSSERLGVNDKAQGMVNRVMVAQQRAQVVPDNADPSVLVSGSVPAQSNSGLPPPFPQGSVGPAGPWQTPGWNMWPFPFPPGMWNPSAWGAQVPPQVTTQSTPVVSSSLPPVLQEKKQKGPSERAVTALPAATYRVGESQEEIQVALPRFYTPEAIARGKPSDKDAPPASQMEYLKAAREVAAALASKQKDFPVMTYHDYCYWVAEWANKFEWTSLMRFDEHFRRMQALGKFQWSSRPMDEFLQMVTLKTTESPTPDANKKKKRAGKCNVFNDGKTCKYDPCKYRHVCSKCGDKTHPKTKCPKA
jgi:hypothetical protein